MMELNSGKLNDFYFNCCKSTIKINIKSDFHYRHLINYHGQYERYACILCLSEFRFIIFTSRLDHCERHLSRVHGYKDENKSINLDTSILNEFKIQRPQLNYDDPSIFKKKNKSSNCFYLINDLVNLNQRFQSLFDQLSNSIFGNSEF